MPLEHSQELKSTIDSSILMLQNLIKQSNSLQKIISQYGIAVDGNIKLELETIKKGIDDCIHELKTKIEDLFKKYDELVKNYTKKE